MALDCSGKFGVVFLSVLNVLFFLLGLGLLIPGILVQVDADVINSKIMPLLDQVSVGSMTLGGAANGLSIAMICLGVFIIIVSLLGLVGACCKVRVCLVIYAIIVLLLFIAKIAIVILYIVMEQKVENEIKTQLKAQLTTNYKSDTLTDNQISTAFNYLNMNLKCCGVDAVTGTTNDYDTSVWQTGGSAGSAQIPKSCCGATEADYTTFSKPACTDNVAAGSGYYATGCFDAIKNNLKKYNIAFIAIGVTVLVVEIIAIIFAFCICKQAGRDDKMV